MAKPGESDSTARLTARTRLIRIQRRLSQEVEQNIGEALGPPSPDLFRHLETYRQCTEHFQSVATFDDVIEGIEDAHVVFVGDYHTLREAQKAPLRVVDAARRSGRSLLLATETVHLEHQGVLDRFLAGGITEAEFLHGIDYERRWGFPWRNHRLPFDFAREYGIPMLALNTDPQVVHDNFSHRDRLAAMRIVEALEEDPRRLLFVHFGDLHVAPDHLPRWVHHFSRSRALDQSLGSALRTTIIYQNSEPIFWQLADQHLEAEAVQVADREYCLLTSTPLVKMQSYLNWELNQNELDESADLGSEAISAQVMTDQVLALLETICRFLGLPAQDGFRVATAHDLDLLTELEASDLFTNEVLVDFERHLVRGESYFFPQGRLIYLSNLSVDHAAEEATHYLHVELSPLCQQMSPRGDFYHRIWREALGFLGSKIVNPKRPCFASSDFERSLSELRGKRLSEEQGILRQVFRDCLRHLEHEDLDRRRSIGRPRFKNLYERSPEVVVGSTHSLGYWLGERLYRALRQGGIERRDVADLFREPLGDDHCESLYWRWSRRLG